MRYASVTQRTAVCKKSLEPVWNRDFRFDLDDEELQDESLELKVWDQDTISSDDSIGIVTIDIAPLLLPGHPRRLAGWFPIYDSLRGA